MTSPPRDVSTWTSTSVSLKGTSVTVRFTESSIGAVAPPLAYSSRSDATASSHSSHKNAYVGPALGTGEG